MKKKIFVISFFLVIAVLSVFYFKSFKPKDSPFCPFCDEKTAIPERFLRSMKKMLFLIFFS